MQKVFILPDTHSPFHVKRFWNLACEAGSYFAPDILVHKGDCFDFNATKQHRKHPKERRDLELLEEELEKARSVLPDMLALKAKRNIFIQGNHEENFERYIADNCPMLHGVKVNGVPLRWDTILGLDPKRWEIVPYRQHVKIGKIFVTHDEGSSGSNAVRNAQSTFEASVIIGHVHRTEFFVRGNAAGRPHMGACFGWLGDPEKATYMHRIKAQREWSHGFGYGYIDNDGTTFLNPSPIVNGRCMVAGKLFKA